MQDRLRMLPPLRFTTLYKARAWGPSPSVSLLRELGKSGLPGERIGESIGEAWEIADLPTTIEGGQSTVLGGPFDGRTLRELRELHRDELLGVATPAPDGGFPLLIKFLDAAENLSVQVHPDAAYVRAHRNAHLKTEAWIVLAAQPGARVYRGLRASTTPAEFRAAVEHGRALEHLESFIVARGDCVYLPSGTCHALGAGILAAEVQTPSDTTFRVWDWDRHDPKRPLHLDEAFSCMKFGAAQSDGRPGFVRFDSIEPLVAGGLATRRLCASDFFRIEWIDARSPSEIPIDATGVPEVWMTLAGRARWRTSSGVINAPTGTTILRPAHVEPGEVLLDENSSILRCFCASPLDRAL
jgi:mannose-6-phosphate isomerase